MNTIESFEVINGQRVKVTHYTGKPTEHALSTMEIKARELRDKTKKKKSTKGKYYKAKRESLRINPDDFCNWNDTALYC